MSGWTLTVRPGPRAGIVPRRQRALLYGGRVLSDRAACERDRRIELYRSNGDFIGDSTTDDEGRWSYIFVGQHYHARATKRVDGSAGHRHICRADRSPTTD